MNDAQYEELAKGLESDPKFDFEKVERNLKPSDGNGFAELTCVYRNSEDLTLVMRICYKHDAWIGSIEGHAFYAFAYKTIGNILTQMDTFNEYFFG